jgi:hypothetical protein
VCSLKRIGPDLVARAGEEEDGRQQTVSGAAQDCRARRRIGNEGGPVADVVVL